MLFSFFRTIAGFAVFVCLGYTGQAQSRRAAPNVILILADDLGYETLGCNGGISYATPNLDRLAATGTRFTQCYATPLCTPSRVQLMTGKYNFRNYERFAYLNPREQTFGNLMKKAGYRTAIAGKWQLGGDEQTPRAFGFDEYCLWQLREGDFWNRYKDPIVTRNGQRDTLTGRYGPDVFTDFLLEFAEKHRREPFFLYYPMCLTHDPFQPPPGHPDFASYRIKGTNDTAYFRPMVEYMDKLVGRIVNRLEELNLRANTVILFAGDNGTSPKVVSRMGSLAVRGDKGRTTTAGTHVPLIVNGPGRVWAGQVNHDLVDFTDFLPTLAALAGTSLPASAAADGQSFYPQLTGSRGKPREWIFCDYDPKGRDFTPRRYAQDHRWKLYADGTFFNLRADRQEEKSIPVAALKGEAKAAYQKLKGVLDQYSLSARRSK